MRTPRGPSRTLWSLHRIASTSDVPTVTRRHNRVGIRNPPDMLSVVPFLADRDADLNPRAEGLLLRPAGESKAGISPRTPSIVSRTCKPKPAGRAHGDLLETAHTRTVSPSAHPRPASGGATDFFLASALSCSPTGLATSRWRRRAMRPTDECHPYESCALAPRAFPARCRGFRRVEALRNLRFRRVDRGRGCFTTPATASADRQRSRFARSTASRPGDTCVGVFFPRWTLRSSL